MTSRHLPPLSPTAFAVVHYAGCDIGLIIGRPGPLARSEHARRTPRHVSNAESRVDRGREGLHDGMRVYGVAVQSRPAIHDHHASLACWLDQSRYGIGRRLRLHRYLAARLELQEFEAGDLRAAADCRDRLARDRQRYDSVDADDAGTGAVQEPVGLSPGPSLRATGRGARPGMD
jgi:hypothetical protein